MRPTRLALALALATFALPMTALAQEAGATSDPAQAAPADQAPADAAPAAAAKEEEEASPNFTWNLSATTDYVFRGVTQTNYQPALQGGLDYSFGDSGWYVGIWGSNVDFNDRDGPDLEIDTYFGWSHDFSEDLSLDLSLVHYGYSGERDGYGGVDYTEVIGKTTWNEMLTFTAAYAPNYSNLDYTSTYFNIGGNWDLGHDFSLNAGVGHSHFGDGNGSYNDWNLGVSRQFGPVNAAVNYYDTNLDLGDMRASDRLVLTLALGNGG